MNQPRNSSRPLLIVVGLIVLATLLFSGLMLASAQESDGRVNPVEHVGGAAVYCVDENLAPAAHWSDGGIRVLDAHGQELLFVPAADIEAAGDPPEEPVLVGTGANAFGTLQLIVLPNSKFQLNGTDEWGKSFEFVWGGCGYTPESPVTTEVPIEPTPTCQIIEGSRAQLDPAAVANPCNFG
ncbi:MAG: hypothetical protein U0452_05010 [Anaerolineae bacterium]